MAETNFDIIVVGGGPGGYVAAIRAAQLAKDGGKDDGMGQADAGAAQPVAGPEAPGGRR